MLHAEVIASVTMSVMNKSCATRVNARNERGRLLIPLQVYMRIVEHAQLTYPYECCGLLVGRQIEFGWEVVRAFPATNMNKERQRDRYEIDPYTIMTVEMNARKQNWELIGAYHSHPDVPAIPSPTDAQLAWKGYVYVIASIKHGRDASMRAWVYHGEGEHEGTIHGFVEIELVTIANATSSHPERNAMAIEGLSPDAELDLRNEVLPFSIIRARERMDDMRPGQVLRILFNCERSVTELPEALEDSGHYVLGVRALHGMEWELWVRCGGRRRRNE
ncbi:MAG TPA: hypothetical protein EYP10_13630 [Armatimonadetes bacterium]|nr:hypothetical protein [Armatimonadota bacterium]